MFEICPNGFNRSVFIDKEGQIKTPLVIAISIIVLLSGLFFILAYYQVLPYGANCISNLGPGGLGLGWGLLGLDLAFLMYHVKKTCSRHPMHTQNLEQQNNIIENVHSSGDPLIASQTNDDYVADTLDWDVCAYTFNFDVEDSITGYMGPPDHPCSDLLSLCKNPNVCILSLAGTNVQRTPLPIQQIKDAFAQGKKMVCALLGTEQHCFALGLCVNGSLGSFKIIDSRYDNSIKCVEVATALNEAKLKNFQGEVIHFSGEYINTHIQRRNECVKFATLYCYHMAEREDLEAYQEVNGAFFEGRLLRFEDYKSISKAQRIRSLKGKSYTYESFMDSWRYRMLGWRVDSWAEFSLQEMFAKFVQESYTVPLIARLSKTRKIPYFLNTKTNNFFIQISSQKRKICAENLQNVLQQVHGDPNIPIQQALSLEENEFLLLWKPDRSFEVFKLESHMRFLAKNAG